MFYSHTYLGRKGPLGIVWCAAHLQHKLKKSHYSSTHIPETVERIIYPEVPLALRMSGHLLLGVVRIYSKKVEYLHHDCNLLWITLRNAFRAPDVNLPDNATQANFNAVTLPDTYALDAIDIDDLSIFDGSPDNHLRSQDEITLQDQNPSNTEIYVRITFDDDIIPDSSNSAGSSHREAETMQIDSRDPDNIDLDIPDTEPGYNQIFEGPEVMRDRDEADFHLSSPVLRPHVHSAIAPDMSPLRETFEKQFDTPRSLRISTPQMHPTHSLLGSGPSSPLPHGEPGSFVADRSTELELRPTPSPERPQPRQKKRKRFFDNTLVLNNRFYKNALNDPSDLVIKRKKLPSTALEMRKFVNNKNGGQVFLDPLISGMCASLQDLSSKDLTVLNPNLLVSEEVLLESRATESPKGGPNFTEEPEHLRSPDRETGNNFDKVFLSPPQSPPQLSTSPRIPSVVTEPQFVSMESDSGLFARSTTSNMDTPIMDFGGTNDNLGNGLSDIPEWRSSLESDDLLFLEQDTNSPADSQQNVSAMSVRTRAVAQYLKNHSPSSKLPDAPIDDLSLNTILEGKPRKICARMFYECLVLKNCRLIDVKQNEPYADITLKLTPSFSQ